MVSKKLVKDLQKKAIESIEKNTGRRPLLIDEMEAKFGVPRYISTGLPSLNLHLFHNEDRTLYGVPYGRVTELHGSEQSFKTSTLLQLAAENIAMGGLSFWNTSEYDFDASYIRKFLIEAGLDPKEHEGMFTFDRFRNLGDLFRNMQGTLAPFIEEANKIEKEGKDPHKHLPPIFIGTDSLGALQGEINFDRTIDDFSQGDQMGTSATELHKFFQTFLHDWARLGVAAVFTNQYRDNIGTGYTKYKPRFESVLKYFSSLRLSLNKGYDTNLTKSKSRLGRDFTPGTPLRVKIAKGRVETVLNSECNLKYYHGYGFDNIGSLIDAAHMSSVVVLKSKVFQIHLEEDDERFKEFDGKKFQMDELRKLLNEDLELAIKIEKLAYKKGADKLEDLRQ